MFAVISMMRYIKINSGVLVLCQIFVGVVVYTVLLSIMKDSIIKYAFSTVSNYVNKKRK